MKNILIFSFIILQGCRFEAEGASLTISRGSLYDPEEDSSGGFKKLPLKNNNSHGYLFLEPANALIIELLRLLLSAIRVYLLNIYF